MRAFPLRYSPLIHDSEFLRVETEYRNAFALRIRQSRALLSRALQPLLSLEGTAIVARGSFARGDLSLYSDIDLVMVSLAPHCRPVLDLDLIKSTVGRSVSLVQFDLSDLDRVATLPHLAHALVHFRYVCGDTKIVSGVVAKAQSTLRNMTPLRLSALRTDDPGRTWKDSDPGSPHYYSLKQGQGGFVDYEFIKLAGQWLKLRRRFNPRIRRALRQSNLAYRYWAILKEFLQLWSGGPLESCQPLYSPLVKSEVPALFRSSVIDSVREVHRHALTVVLEEIQKEIQA